jgi:anti-sigma factor RsiW
MMSNKCDDFKDKIAELISGTLPDSESNAVQEHKQQCKDCAEFEQALRAEDASLTHLFDRFSRDFDRQQDEVIKAIGCFSSTAKDRILPAVRAIVDNPVVKLAAAAAVIAFVTFNCVRAMSWLHELERFMDICAVTIK